MARGKPRVSARENRAALAVLAALVLIGVWLTHTQGEFNPAVTAYLTHAKNAAPGGAAVPADSAGASMLAALSGVDFAGPAEYWNPDTLSDKIDGKAELYLSSGFKEMNSRPFALPGAGVRVEAYVYEMASPKDAFAVHSGQRRPDAAESGVAPGAYATQNALFFTRGPFYVELVADKPSPELIGLLEGVAQGLLASLPGAPGGQSLAEAALLPPAGRADASMRMTVSDAFGLEGFANVFTADYALASGEATGYATLRDNAGLAKAQADAYEAFLAANGYMAVQDPGLPPGAKLYTLENMAFETVLVSGDVLVGVHEATTRQAAVELTAALANILSERKP